MRSTPSTLAPFFRSDAQGRVLGCVVLNERHVSMSQIAADTGLPLTTVQREVARLEQADVLRTTKQGNTRLVRTNTDYPLRTALAQIVAATYGPLPAVSKAFDGLAGVEYIAIFGSWAARYSGTPGPPPADIDVLVVGDVSKMDVYERAIRAGQVVGRDVNPTIMSARRWHDATDGFVQEVSSRPLVPLLARSD